MFRQYPRQFWYLVFGMLISSTGMGMIWPFLTIYMRQRLDVPLTTITALLTLDSIMSIASSFVAGPIADRFGRKWVMVLSLGMMGLIYVLMSGATSLPIFALLMGLRGAFVPLYRIGADAMVADLIPENQRIEAYSISRTVNNIGVALGPSAGGFVTGSSYTAAFFIAAVCLFFFSIFSATVMHETMPHRKPGAAVPQEKKTGYGRIFRDRDFLIFTLGFTLVGMASSLVFVLLTTYGKENFGLPESQFGFVMAVNALMVVFFQFAVTRFTRKLDPLKVMVTGALLYGLGVGSVALGSTAPHFAISMVIMTLGELTLVPTSTTLAANLAPPEMRGRYMSFYNLGWGISHGFGPVVGGILNDTVAPVSMWYGGLVWGLLGALVFFKLSRNINRKQKAQAAEAEVFQPVETADRIEG
jgi:MFS family permease